MPYSLMNTDSKRGDYFMEKSICLESHPWIDFTLDTRGAGHRFWMLLGEAQSKCRHIAGVPLSPDVAAHFHRVYLSKGARATTAIEGNTLSEEEVEKIIQGKLELPASKKYLEQEIRNIVDACNLIGGKIRSGSVGNLSVEELLEDNRLVLKGLPDAEKSMPGQIRTFGVTVGRYRGVPAGDCRTLLEKLCSWLNDPSSFDLGKGNEIASGILKAILGHLYLVWIHPFGDGNGRTARLLEFRMLLEAGAPTPAAHLLSNHYNETRTEYYRHLENASANHGVLKFIEYALGGFVDQLEEQVKKVRILQWEAAWQNHVHEEFKNNATEMGKRREALLLSMSNDFEKRSRFPFIDPEVAALYRNKTAKTVSRDISALEKRGLVETKGDLVRARKETILAFLPLSKPEALSSLLEGKKRFKP